MLGRKPKLTVVALTVAMALATGPAASAATAPPARCPGETGYLVQDFQGDQVSPTGFDDAPANADIEGVYFKWDTDASGNSVLTANLQIANLDETQPSPADSTSGTQYYVWFAWNGTLKYVEAVSDSTGTSFNYGTGDTSTGSWSSDGSTTGAFYNGEHGVVSIVVPAVAGGTLGQKFGDVAGTVAYGYGGGPFSLDSDADQAPDNGDPFLGASGLNYTVMNCTDDAAAKQQNAGPPSSGPAPAGPEAIGAPEPRFDNISPSLTYETSDILERQNAGEPSLGVDWKTGAVLYMAGTQVSKVLVNDSSSPATATWTDVTPPQQSLVNEDAILFTDHQSGQTLAEGLLVAGANGTYSNDDGTSWMQTQGFPEPHGPDHETVGAGPYHAPAPPTASADGVAWYYCSQNILVAAGAFCGRSDTEGKTWNPSSHLFGAGTPCGSIHGHVKVGPDGTVYVPQNSCTRPDGQKGQGMGVSADDGMTWTYSVVPDSKAKPPNAGTDPSIGVGAHNSVYYGYEDGSGHPKIAVSHDHGAHWEPSVDVGAPLGIQNSKFPEVVAGDDERAAYAWLGTTTPGDDQAADFKGVWYLYVSFTYDGGKTWTTVDATPGDPVQRGCIWNGGGGNACRNLLDFNDATVDKQGRVLVAYTDGCADYPYTYQSLTGEAEGLSAHGPSRCDSQPNSYADTDKVSLDGLARQSCGTGLFAAYDGTLPTCSAAAPATPSGDQGSGTGGDAGQPAPAPAPAPEVASGPPPAGQVLGARQASQHRKLTCAQKARRVKNKAKRRAALRRCHARHQRHHRRR